MSASPQPRMTPEQYLEFEREAEFHHEYYHGIVYAMSGGSNNHAILIAHLAASLVAALRKKPCSVTVSDMRLRVTPDGLYTYPDVMVHCGEHQYVDSRKDILVNPTVVIEVLSPSTEAYDRGFKFHQYKLVESLQEYALVSQSEPRIEVFRKQSQGAWLIQESLGLEARCALASIDCELLLSEVYDKVVFDPSQIAANRPKPDLPR
jgi:Uma2 family endonuclease